MAGAVRATRSAGRRGGAGGRAGRARADGGEEGEESHTVHVAVRTGGRVVGLGHRPPGLEGRVAGAAAVLVQRHRRQHTYPAWLTGAVAAEVETAPVRPLPRTATITETRPEVDRDLETGEPAAAHIVK